MKYIDLFAGVGGFRYGIERAEKLCNQNQKLRKSTREAGNKIGQIKQLPEQRAKRLFDCVYSNEWDKYANSVYRKHFGECDNRDIRTVPAEEIPDHDLLCGGFPCQSFSVAGKRGGFSDTRGTLFFEIARILKQKQPRLFLLENVKGLLSHDKGNTFAVILSTLDELGYDAEWQVLNSKNFGVPQNRERVFIIGHLRGEPRPQVFPILETNGKDIVQLNQPTHSNDRIYSDKGMSPTLNTMQGGRRQPKIANTIDANYYKGINVNPGHASSTRGITDGLQIRRLTPTECERLQGFPDNWTKYGHDEKEMSDTQRYKMMGNAVTTNVITYIVERLLCK